MQGRINLAGVLAVVGAAALLVGLSLEWFEPEISAWTAFEVVDLLLAAIAITVVAATLGRSPSRPWLERTAGWLAAAAFAALVLVLASLVNKPPAAVDRSIEIGAWVSLGGAFLLVVAAILATTEVSVVVALRPRQRERERERARAAEEAALAPDDAGWQPVEEPFDAPPREQPTDENPIAAAEVDEDLVEPADEDILPPGEDVELAEDDETGPQPLDDDETGTQPLPPRRRD